MPSTVHTSDFEVVDTLFDRISEKKSTLGIASLTPPERVVYFIWSALGIIENGSFQYLFENDVDIEAVAESLAELGLDSTARSFREAKKILISGGHLQGWSEKLRFLQQHESALDSLACGVIQRRKEIEAILATYIRSHGNVFPQLHH